MDEDIIIKDEKLKSYIKDNIWLWISILGIGILLGLLIHIGFATDYIKTECNNYIIAKYMNNISFEAINISWKI